MRNKFLSLFIIFHFFALLSFSFFPKAPLLSQYSRFFKMDTNWGFFAHSREFPYWTYKFDQMTEELRAPQKEPKKIFRQSEVRESAHFSSFFWIVPDDKRIEIIQKFLIPYFCQQVIEAQKIYVNSQNFKPEITFSESCPTSGGL